MNLKDLEIEKQKVLNVQQNFYNKLFERFKEYEIELNKCKEKLILANEEIIRLKFELEIYIEEKQINKDTIENLRYEITKLEDEIYQLKYNDTNNKIEIIEDLKEAFIDNNEEEVEELIDEILEDIVEIEEILRFEDIIFLMYICYFNDRLKVLLGKSQVANIIYTENSNESKLLNILVQEESSKVHSIIEDCTRSYIYRERDIFSKLEKEVAQRIKETLEDFSYKSFEEVYVSSKIKQGDKVVLTKAWVRHKDSMSWKLVSGLYSVANNELYLEENMIEILGLKEGQVEVEETQISNLYNEKEDIYREVRETIAYHINSIKNEFLMEKPERFKTLMKSKKNSPELKRFDDILALDISEDTITKKGAYTLLIIALFYGAHNKLITKSSYLKELYESQVSEGKMLRILDYEVRISPGFKIDLPVRVFLEKNKDTLIYIDNNVKMKVIKLIKIYFSEEFKKIVVSDKRYKNSTSAGKNLVFKMGYIKLSNELGESKYVLFQDITPDECNTMYITNKIHEKINTMINGYTMENSNVIVVNKSSLLNISEGSKQSNTKIDVLYKDLLNYFNEDNLGYSLLTFNKIIDNKNDLKQLTNVQAITLRFIGYLIKNSTFGADKIQIDSTIGVVPEGIIYEKMINGLYFRDLLEKNKSNLSFIDPIVRENMIKRLEKLDNNTKKVKLISSNNEDFDCGNLNTESEIRKLGYSTSVSREERWKILENKAIPKLGKSKVVGHIKFLIKMNKGRKIMANAVNEWEYDLNRLNRL